LQTKTIWMLVQKGGVDLYRELATDLWSMREFREC